MNRLKTFMIIFFMFVATSIFSSSALATQIALDWDAPTTNEDGSPLTDLAGYRIYYGTSSGRYGTPIDVGKVTTYVVSGLTSGRTYYFVATAYDTSGNESDYSNEVNGVATDMAKITVATSPSGRQIAVDSTTYIAPQTFNWVVGSSHTLSVSSPQTGSTGVLYSYSSWSDGGNATHSITVPSLARSYTANFTTLYSLTTLVTPSGGGKVTPSGTNWYNSGQSVSLSATPNWGYSFSGWTGDLTGSTNPTPLTMNGPKNVVANFKQVQGASLPPCFLLGSGLVGLIGLRRKFAR